MYSSCLNPFSIASIEFSDLSFSLILTSGKTLTFLLSQGRFANIRELNSERRNNWLLVDDNFGVYWPDVQRPAQFAGVAMINSLDLVWEKATEDALDKLSKLEWNFDQLSEVEKDTVALWRLESDIYNGGFMQFFCNWGEVNCQIAISSLEKIGAVYTHKIVTRMRELLNRMENHPEVRELTDIYVVMNDDERTEMQKLDEDFWKDPDGLVQKIVSYFSNYFVKSFNKQLIDDNDPRCLAPL
jgi:Domain of unknown function (DUF4375)